MLGISDADTKHTMQIHDGPRTKDQGKNKNPNLIYSLISFDLAAKRPNRMYASFQKRLERFLNVSTAYIQTCFGL